MTNSFQSLSSLNPRRRASPLKENECLALFQLFSEPALLVDWKRQQVAQANPAFLQITAFSLNEVLGRIPTDFLSDMPELNGIGEDDLPALLQRRGRDPLGVSVMMRALDSGDAWRVLICRANEDIRKKKARQIANMTRGLAALDRILPTREGLIEPDGAVKSGIEIIQKVFEVEAVGVYQNQPDNNGFMKFTGCGESNLLPESLSSGDITHLDRPQVWRPGRRMQTALHRTARVKGLSYLATAQFEPQGLLVIASRKGEPWDDMEDIVQLLAGRLGHLLVVSMQFSQLKTRISAFQNELVISRQAMEKAGEGILLLNPDLTIREINTAAEWMLGYTSWETQGQAVENIIIGPERLSPALEEARNGVPIHNMGVVPIHRRNGLSFPAQVQVIPVDQDGELLALMVLISDSSEHEEIKQRSQQFEQRAVLGDLSAVFAHEVRNPINNIATGLQLLSVKLNENDPNQDNINRLIGECQRLNHLMENVLNFSRQTELKFQEVDLDMLLRRLLDRWHPRMTKVNVDCFISAEPGTVHALGDARSLEQVFTNLVSNAIEAMGLKGGTLAVRLSPCNALPGHPQVEVTISDTGPGIPDEIKDRIFEPFVTSKSQGTGLGLAITKRIVTAHHGSINVNTFPGGTVFHVLLSAYQGEAP